MARILFARSAYEKIEAEVSRWHDIGVEKEGKPYEAAGFPLSRIVYREGKEKSPFDQTKLDDIELVIVTDVLIPPDEIKNYGPHNVNFRKEGIDLEEYSRRFSEEQITPAIKQNPLLEIVSRLHSHPFTDKCWNSEGDLFTIRNDEIEAKRHGFLVSFSFIMVKSAQHGPAQDKKETGTDWSISCIAIEEGIETIVPISLVDDLDPLMIPTKDRPYYTFEEGRAWEEQLFASFEKNKRVSGINRISRGWTCIWIKTSGKKIVLAIPPFFPRGETIRYISSEGGKFESTSLRFEDKMLCDIDPDTLIGEIRPAQLLQEKGGKG